MIRTEGLSYVIGDFGLQNVSLEVAPGDYFVLLGRPGAGKTVFLECVCGLRRVGEGRILINDRDVTRLEPRERSIGYMPQDYALFPHQNVWGNIAFGLRRHHIPKKETEQRVADTAELLGIAHLLSRDVQNLSGGERQRAALARALVLAPKALLLDEPVSALDEATREGICAQLKQIQRETGTTAIHVSHNFDETRMVADRVGILQDGELVQVGTPDEVFRHPANPETARFLRAGNVLTGTAEPRAELTALKIGETEILCTARAEGKTEFVIPAEAISVSLDPPGPAPSDTGMNILVGTITACVPRGPLRHVSVRVSPELTLGAYATQSAGRLGTDVRAYLHFGLDAVHIF